MAAAAGEDRDVFDAPRRQGELYASRRRDHCDDRSQRDGSALDDRRGRRSEEHTSELQSLMRISYAVFCLKKKKTEKETNRKYEMCTTHIHQQTNKPRYRTTKDSIMNGE